MARRKAVPHFKVLWKQRYKVSPPVTGDAMTGVWLPVRPQFLF